MITFHRGCSAALLFLCYAVPLSAASSVSIREEGDYRYIESNGIPDHETGHFPNSGNPNKISEQSYHFRVPLHPNDAGHQTPLGHDLFGVALNGVPFDPGTAEYWNNERSSEWNYEALSAKINLGIDEHHAHVQPNGAYHYHGVPTGAVRSGASSELVGYAADGFSIYYDSRVKSSFRLKEGIRPSGPGRRYDGTFVNDYQYIEGAGDLDECNGRSGATSKNAPGAYYYYITEDFPFIPRCFKGIPDPSFKKTKQEVRNPSSQGRQSRRGENSLPGGGPPDEAIQACRGKNQGEMCAFQSPRGMLEGVCEDIPEGFTACVPHDHHAEHEHRGDIR